MKNYKLQLLGVVLFVLLSSLSFSQEWKINGNNNVFSGVNYLGTINNQAIDIRTYGMIRAQFTTGNAMTSLTGNSGDGLRLLNPNGVNYGHLESCLSGILPTLCSLSNNAIQENSSSQQEVINKVLSTELSNENNIVLTQNVPNPFAEMTLIKYSISKNFQNAKIVFYDQFGENIKTVELLEAGNGELNVYGADLSSGVYMYSLIIDEQIITTKTMVKQ